MATILYNELRQIKDSLPHGAMDIIAAELKISVETVKDYFKAITNVSGEIVHGVHYEKGGSEGGIVMLEDTAILEVAVRILQKVE